MSTKMNKRQTSDYSNYKSKIKQNSQILLERLPNELLSEILSYLNGVDAFIAFSSLNNRFQDLLLQYSKLFSFKSVSKTKFDRVFQRYDTQQWLSLRLFNDQNTPGQIDYFIEKYSSINRFSRLRSLSVLSTAPLNEDTFSQLPFVENLVSLTIGPVCGTKIFRLNLPNLKNLVLASCENIDWNNNFSQLTNLEYTNVTHCCWRGDLTFPFTLKRLKINFSSDTDVDLREHSFERLSQLTTLEICQKKREHFREDFFRGTFMGHFRAHFPPNGQKWEQLIRSTLPLLKNFRFYFQFYYDSSASDVIKQIVESFSTPFYILEHNWFIRCDINESKPSRCHAVLYSLPYTFDQFTIVTDCFDKSLSTLPAYNNNQLNRNMYQNIKTLIFKNDLLPDENFNRIKIMNLYMNKYVHLTEWIHTLTALRHLEIGFQTKMWSKNFGRLLENLPHLCSLSVEKSLLKGMTKNWTNTIICNRLSNMIRSLELRFRYSHSSRDDLHEIVRIFGRNCEHLSIDRPMSTKEIGFIFQKMSKLHSLHAQIISLTDTSNLIRPQFRPPFHCRRFTSQPKPSITMLWIELESHQKRFNRSNSIMTNYLNHYHFWLGNC